MAGDDIDLTFAHCVLCLESSHQKRGTIKYCEFVMAQQISPSCQISEILSQWTWIAEQLDLSVLMWIFFKLTLVSVPALLYRKDKENVIIGG